MLTKLELQARLQARLAAVDEPARARIVEEVAERYRAPGPKRSRWRVSRGIQLTEPGQPAVSVVERSDGSCEVYTAEGTDHKRRAEVVAEALNAIEDELGLTPPVAP